MDSAATGAAMPAAEVHASEVPTVEAPTAEAPTAAMPASEILESPVVQPAMVDVKEESTDEVPESKRPRLSEVGGCLGYDSVVFEEVTVTLPKDNGKSVTCMNISLAKDPTFRYVPIRFFRCDDPRNEVVYRFGPSSFEQPPIGTQGKTEGWRLPIKLDHEQARFIRKIDELVLAAIQRDRVAIFGSRVTEAQVRDNFISSMKPHGENDFLLGVSTRLVLKEGAKVKLTEWRLVDKDSKQDMVLTDFRQLQDEVLPAYRNFQGAGVRLFIRPQVWIVKPRCGVKWTAEAALVWASKSQGSFGSVAGVSLDGL